MQSNRYNLPRHLNLFAELFFMAIVFCRCTSLKNDYLILTKETEFQDPVIYMLAFPEDGETALIPIKFPEDMLRFTECCEQDTIRNFPIASHFNRVEKLSKIQQDQEVETYNRIWKRLMTQKKKYNRIIAKKEIGYVKKTKVTYCECVLEGDRVSIHRLRLFKSIK